MQAVLASLAHIDLTVEARVTDRDEIGDMPEALSADLRTKVGAPQF